MSINIVKDSRPIFTRGFLIHRSFDALSQNFYGPPLDIVGHPEILAKRAPISRSFLAVRQKKIDQPASLKSTTSRQRSQRNGKLRIFALLTLQEYYFTRFSLVFPSIFRKGKRSQNIDSSIHVVDRYILSVRFSRVNFLIHRIKFFLFFFQRISKKGSHPDNGISFQWEPKGNRKSWLRFIELPLQRSRQWEKGLDKIEHLFIPFFFPFYRKCLFYIVR